MRLHRLAGSTRQGCGRRPGRAVLAAALALSFVALPSAASPRDPAPTPNENGPNDPVAQLLAERGLLSTPTPATGAGHPPDATAPSLAQQVRDRTSELVVSAMNFLGVPYRRGGNDADSGFDCSGFTKHLFEMTFGLVLPRRVDDQANAAGLVKVSRQELQPGDLVFFNTLRRTFSHVGIYVGEGRFIHAPRTGAEVRVEDMRGAYWNQRFTGARRVADGTATLTSASEPRARPLARTPSRPAAPPAPRQGPAPTTPAPAAPDTSVGPQSPWQP